MNFCYACNGCWNRDINVCEYCLLRIKEEKFVLHELVDKSKCLDYSSKMLIHELISKSRLK